MVLSVQDIKDKIRERMGIKFVLALSAWIVALMLLGTLFVSKMILDYQERALEAKGREIGTVLGKAIIDRLMVSDVAGLNTLTADVLKSSRDMLSIVIVSMDGVPLTTARTSFNHADPDVKALLDSEKTDDVGKLSAAIRSALAPVEVAVEINLEGTRLGELQLAFSRAGVRANTARIALLLLGTALFIVASLSALVYFMVHRMIIAPTKAAETVASRVASGNLTQTVKVKSVDELGNLGRGLNSMISGLKGMVGNLRESAGKLETVSTGVADASGSIAAVSRLQSDAVEEAASSVNEMHFSLKEIAANVEDLNETAEQTSSSVIETAASVEEVARTMNELASSIEETSTAITQMSAAIRQIAEHVETLSAAAEQTATSTGEISASVREVEANARQSAALAEAVSADAQQLGMRSIEKTIDGMHRIEEESRRTAEVINRLGERAESIGGILTVIEDITDQTSLLALNAAILAAQAGEHGKGFAVVAAEIRELANRTASSTKEIGSLIGSVQEESRSAVEVMRTGVRLTDEGVRLAQDAGDALRKILDRAAQSRDMSGNISRAAAEQTTGMRQVSEAVDRINAMTHQIAKATAEQRGGSEQISRAAEKMREITRFVKNATTEQVKASKGITEAVETMSAKVGMVNRGATEVKTGSDLIVKAIDRIKTTARDNTEMAGRLNSAVEVLTTQTSALKKEIEKFTT